MSVGIWVESEHFEFAFVRAESQDRFQRRGLACAIWPDQADDAPFFNGEIDSSQRDGLPIGLADPACLNQCAHSPSPGLFVLLSLAANKSPASKPKRWIVANTFGHSSCKKR